MLPAPEYIYGMSQVISDSLHHTYIALSSIWIDIDWNDSKTRFAY